MVKDQKLVDQLYAMKLSIIEEILYDINFQRWSQKDFCQASGLHQGEASELMNGNARRFSADRLLMILMKLGHKPTVSVC